MALFLWFFRAILVGIFVEWFVMYRRVRADPDWEPTRLWRFAFFGPVDRDRILLNAKGGMLVAPIFLVLTFFLPGQ